METMIPPQVGMRFQTYIKKGRRRKNEKEKKKKEKKETKREGAC